MGTTRRTPTEVGIEDVNLKVTTDNNGNNLDVRKAFAWTAIVDITETGSPTTGAADLIVDIMESVDSSTETTSHTIASGIDIQTNGEKATIVWGHGVVAAAIGTGTQPTISTTPDVVANADFIRLNLKASTANDGTTCTGSVTLLIEEA
jgi:hypothetical protein